MSSHRHQAESELDPDAARIRQRLRALRSRYPGVALATDLTHIHDDQVVIRATLTLPDGTSVSAYAAEPTDSSGLLDTAIELSEQRATSRALDLLGVGEVPPQPRRSDPTADMANDDLAPPPVIDALRKARRPAGQDQDDHIDPVHDAEPEGGVDVEAVATTPPESSTGDEPDLADYTWTHFWTWARANNLSTKGQVEQRIGQPIDSMTPRDVRQMLHDTGIPI